MAKDKSIWGRRLQPPSGFLANNSPPGCAPGVQGSSRPDDLLWCPRLWGPPHHPCAHFGKPFPGEEILLCSPLSCPVPLHNSSPFPLPGPSLFMSVTVVSPRGPLHPTPSPCPTLWGYPQPKPSFTCLPTPLPRPVAGPKRPVTRGARPPPSEGLSDGLSAPRGFPLWPAQTVERGMGCVPALSLTLELWGG